MHIHSYTAIVEWLKNKIATINHIQSDQIKEDVLLSEYNLDSLQAVTLTGELEEWLKIDVDPTIIWDYPTVKELAEFLAQEIKNVAGALE